MEESNTEERKGSQLSLLNEPNYNGLEHTSFPSFPLDYEVPVSSKHVSDCNKTQTSQNMNSSANEGHSPTSDSPVYNTLQDPDYEKLESSEDMYSVPTNNVNESKIRGQLSQDSSSNREAPAYSTLEDPDYEKLRKEQDMYSVPSNDPQGNKSTVEESQTSSGSLPNQDVPVYSLLENPDYERLREHPTSDNQRSAGPPPNYKAPVYSTLDDPDYEKLKITQGTHEVPYNSGNDRKSITGDIQQSPTSPVYSTLEDSNYEKFDEPMTPAVQEGRSSPVPPPNYEAPVYQEDGHYKRLQRTQDTHNVSSNESEDKIPTSPVYSTLEDVHHYERVQKVQDMHERPAYNILERPETKWKTLQGPVYEVPKDPKSATNSLRNPVRSEYNTLEHPPNRRNEQLKEMHSEVSYNVLDRPEAKWASKKKTNSEEPKSSGGHVYEVI